jgi:hypothetical protein
MLYVLSCTIPSVLPNSLCDVHASSYGLQEIAIQGIFQVGWENFKKHTMLLQLFTCTTKTPFVKGQRGVKQNADAFAFLEEYMAANMMRTAGRITGISSLD